MAKWNQYYINREISWLSFNHRVLQEAKDKRNPLLERLKYLAIFANNLDEFFKVRVATLKRLIHLKSTAKKELNEPPERLLSRIKTEVVHQRREFDRIFKKEILEELKQESIYFLNERTINGEHQNYLENYFIKDIHPRLEPVFIEDDGQPLFMRDNWIYFAVHLKDDDGEENAYAILKLPENLPRFITLPPSSGKNYVIYIDDIIRFHLPDIFPGFQNAKAYGFRILRDAELDIEGDISRNLLRKIKESLKKRELGEPTRLSYDPEIPAGLLQLISKKVNIEPEDTMFARKYHDFTDFFHFPFQKRQNLKFNPMPPLPHPAFEGIDDYFSAIGEQDQLLHLPYQRFTYILNWLEQAKNDPDVTHITITLYRLAKHSEVVQKLIKASHAGKKVTVFIELKARFDEAYNIHWFNQLENAGAEVLYSMERLKVHSKLLIISRREENSIRQYAYFSTGNFNEDTAKTYSDTGLFTADQDLIDEAQKIVDYLTQNTEPVAFDSLMVSPFNLRRRINQLIDKEIQQAKNEKEAWIWIKVNSLQDPKIVQKLYKASNSGVHIYLITRSICSLVPGIEGVSKNIQVISLVDRLLEHSRIYAFCNGGDTKVYMGSADLMKRNLDQRIELVFPIKDEKCKQEILYFLRLQWADNQKARWIDARQSNVYREEGLVKTRAQYDFYESLTKAIEESNAQEAGYQSWH